MRAFLIRFNMHTGLHTQLAAVWARITNHPYRKEITLILYAAIPVRIALRS